MALTIDVFLDLACQWVVEHHTYLVDDDQFLPMVKSRGASDADIHRIKTQLQHGAIKNHSVITGWLDFTVNNRVFCEYIRKTKPKLFERGQALLKSHPGAVTATL